MARFSISKVVCMNISIGGARWGGGGGGAVAKGPLEFFLQISIFGQKNPAMQ